MGVVVVVVRVVGRREGTSGVDGHAGVVCEKLVLALCKVGGWVGG